MCELEGHRGWEFMLKFYAEQLLAIQETLIQCENELQLRQLQGRAQVFKDLLDRSHSARDELERLRKIDKEAAEARRQRKPGIPEGLPVRT